MLRLISTHGSDNYIALYSRICFGKEYIADADVDRQIKLLLQPNPKHEKPFEFASMTFLLRCSRACHSQLATHRMASMISMSHRYAQPLELIDQTLINRLPEDRKNHMVFCLGKYLQMIEKGVSREDARGVLPMDTLIKSYWQVNLRSLFNFLQLRLEKSSQSEIRSIAHMAYRCLQEEFPVTAKYFTQYYLEVPSCTVSTSPIGSMTMSS